MDELMLIFRVAGEVLLSFCSFCGLLAAVQAAKLTDDLETLRNRHEWLKDEHNELWRQVHTRGRRRKVD